MDSVWSVYKHTNKINGKVYIGITHLLPENRWMNGKGYQNQVFGRAISKYGWENFEHEILYHNLTQQEAEAKEIETISFYKSNDRDFGYNVSSGGNIGTSSIARLSKTVYQYSLDGKFIKAYKSASEAALSLNETPCKITIVCRLGTNHISCGYRWSYIYKGDKLIKDDMDNPNYYTKIHQYDIEGNYIASYDSISDAERATGIGNSKISSCAKGINAFTKDYRWSYDYYESLEPLDKTEYMYKKVTSLSEKPVYQYTKDGKFVAKYKSIADADKTTGVDFRNISACKNGKKKTAGGYKWFPIFMGDNLNVEEINESVQKTCR